MTVAYQTRRVMYKGLRRPSRSRASVSLLGYDCLYCILTCILVAILQFTAYDTWRQLVADYKGWYSCDLDACEANLCPSTGRCGYSPPACDWHDCSILRLRISWQPLDELIPAMTPVRFVPSCIEGAPPILPQDTRPSSSAPVYLHPVQWDMSLGGSFTYPEHFPVLAIHFPYLLCLALSCNHHPAVDYVYISEFQSQAPLHKGTRGFSGNVAERDLTRYYHNLCIYLCLSTICKRAQISIPTDFDLQMIPVYFNSDDLISSVSWNGTSQRALYVQCTYIVHTVGTMYVQCTYIVRTVPAGMYAHVSLSATLYQTVLYLVRCFCRS